MMPCAEGIHTEKKARKCVLPESVGEAICRWWADHRQIAVSNLGLEVCAHVHAAAVSVATSIYEQGVFPNEKSWSEVFSAACHTMALKYVVGDTNSNDGEVSELRLVGDIGAILAEWGARHSASQIRFAEVTMVNHGMYRLRQCVDKL